MFKRLRAIATAPTVLGTVSGSVAVIAPAAYFLAGHHALLALLVALSLGKLAVDAKGALGSGS